MKPWVFIPLVLGVVLGSTDPQVLVVTVATEETDGLRRLLRSAEAFDIPIKVFGLGETWNGGNTRIEQGGGQKINILKEGLKEFKDDTNTIIIFVDAYDVVFAYDLRTILFRFFDHFSDYRVVFSAEPFCWPDDELALEYPVVEFGKRYLNSGLFMGYASDVYKMLTVKEVEDKDDDQLYYTMIYLDEKLRKDLKMTLDSMSRIFQNLNGVVDDVELQFDDAGDALAYNAAYNTHPAIIHGNGPSKRHLDYLSNYLAKKWSSITGCYNCGDKSRLDLKDTDESDFPLVSLSIFIFKPIPFVEEVLTAISNMNYPKDRLALFIYNSQPQNIKTVMNFLSKHGSKYATKKVINGVTDIGEREAREQAIAFAERSLADFLWLMDGDVMNTNENTLRNLIQYSENYEIDVVAPMLGQIGKLFANFWGAVANNGYYARSEDYLALVHSKRIGYFNVPFITSSILISKKKFPLMRGAFGYNNQIDPDMSFCQFARDNGYFLYINNEMNSGFLVESDQFADTIKQGHLHPEMWQMFENRPLWEARYVHKDYFKYIKEDAEVPQACPDVYDYPLMSERYCEEMIEEMENFGKWSDGANQDRRLAGGYENVPTRDIHMNQIGYEREWLYFLDEYVRPMQEKTFIGYFHRPIEANMMFVVRYRPDEQASLRPHHDASTFSIDVALNKRDRDFEGGGVRYVRYNCTVPADEVGHTMMFPGRLTHMHEGLPTTKGTRYILVSFINP